MIKIGILGSGMMAKDFLKAINLTKGYKVVGIASPHSKERLEELKEEYNIDYYSLDIDKVINDKNIDVIYIALVNSRHYELAKKALEADKDVILEKPFTINRKEAEELITLANAKNKIILEAITLVHMPNFKKIKELVKDLGKIEYVKSNYCHMSSRYKNFEKGIIAPVFDKKYAGGALLDLNVYNVHLTYGLFGRPISVSYDPEMERDIDVGGKLVLDYKDFKAELTARKNVSEELYILIKGEKGQIRIDDSPNSLSNFTYEGKQYRLNTHSECMHYHEFDEFKKIIENRDFNTVKELNQETIAVMDILDRARNI